VWFPKPAGPSDIQFVGPAATLTKQAIFDLLTSVDAVEWRDRVGVAGPVDGSGKDTSRLLASGGSVLKTNLDLAVDDESTAFERTRTCMHVGGRTQIWHHEKVWAYYCFENRWYPLSITREMTTLRRITGQKEKMAAWTRMMLMAVETAVAHEIGMDLNPANFAQLPDDPRLYYIDDEWYPALTYFELAAAGVARIPEEPKIRAADWESWGAVLSKIFEPLCTNSGERMALVDSFADHPIAAKFDAKRKALLRGLNRIHPARKKRSKKSADEKPTKPQFRRTAIIADVHGNLSALNAVLDECGELGADSYIFLGDAVGYGPNPKQCIEKLAELPNASYVRGNHDHGISIGVFSDGMNGVARQCAEWTYEQLSETDRQWLMSLPVDVKEPGWLAVHGAPKDPRRFIAYVYELTYQDNLQHMVDANLRLCFYGHTHVQTVYERNNDGVCRDLKAPELVKVSGSQILLLNPGSVGQPRDGDTRAGFAIWDRKTDLISLRRVSYPVSEVVDALSKLGLPSALGDRLLRGR
jgi:diadenosine tetraphosphatase ApaH/serine/threonine PP2A family protein phosphatase